MKFLIAGYGSIGRRHLNNLKALGETDILLYRTHHSTLPEDEIKDIPVETDLEGCIGTQTRCRDYCQSLCAAPGSCHSLR